MRILFLTYEFCGATALAEGLANDLGYTFIKDPMCKRFAKYRNTLRSNVLQGGDGNNINGVERVPGYTFPDSVPDNTIMTHNVKLHRYPGNLTEEQFVDQLRAKFDRTIIIKRENCDLSWKLKCLAHNLMPHLNNNSDWKEFIYNDIQTHIDRIVRPDVVPGVFDALCPITIWDDSLIDESVKNNIVEAHTFLQTYGNENSIVTTNIEDLGYNHINEQDKSIEEMNTEVSRWLISEVFSGIDFTSDPQVGVMFHSALSTRSGQIY